MCAVEDQLNVARDPKATRQNSMLAAEDRISTARSAGTSRLRSALAPPAKQKDENPRVEEESSHRSHRDAQMSGRRVEPPPVCRRPLRVCDRPRERRAAGSDSLTAGRHTEHAARERWGARASPQRGQRE
jgi:hypothetical protein